MRIGIRSAISGLVLMSIVVSAVGVHLLWWRTANQVSQTLADTINDQIVSAVGDQLQSVTTEARSASIAVRALLAEKVLDNARCEAAQVVFLSQLQAQPTISWVAFGWPDGSFFAAHKLGDTGVEMLEIAPDRNMLRSSDTNMPAAISSSGTAGPRRPNIWSPNRNGIGSPDPILVDADGPSDRRAARGGVCRADRDRRQACRRARDHHRTDAGVELPVAAHGRKIGRRLHPRAGRLCDRFARRQCRRTDAAENRSSVVSGRRGRDPEGGQRL